MQGHRCVRWQSLWQSGVVGLAEKWREQGGLRTFIWKYLICWHFYGLFFCPSKRFAHSRWSINIFLERMNEGNEMTYRMPRGGVSTPPLDLVTACTLFFSSPSPQSIQLSVTMTVLSSRMKFLEGSDCDLYFCMPSAFAHSSNKHLSTY